MKTGDDNIKGLFKDLGVCSSGEYISKEGREIDVISSGSFLLDKAIGIGGWPVGKIIEFFGADSSGKTTLALHALAEAQKLNKLSVYIDLENTLHLEWAKKIGVDVENLYVARPESGEKVFELIKRLLESEKVDLIIVDSVAALVPSFEFENNIEDQTMGLHARLMSKGLRIIQSLMIGKSTTIIFINQIREKIGVNAFIPSTVTTGGRALRYSACIRVEVKRCERIQDSSGHVIGFETKFTLSKNKYGSPMECVKSAIYFDRGFDVDHEVIVNLLDSKKLLKKGSWLEFEGKNLAQGMVQLRGKMKKSQELRQQLLSASSFTN